MILWQNFIRGIWNHSTPLCKEMKKQILEYIEYLESEIDSIDSKKIDDLIALNKQRIRDFQHERLVHLFVMLFFGFLCVVSVVSFFISVNTAIFSDGSLMSRVALAALIFVLFIVEVFYIKHYYFLENTIQKIYEYEKTLYEIQKKQR